MRDAGPHNGHLALEEGVAQAFWLREPGYGEIRPVRLPEPGPGDVVVPTLRSGISRGTETLVFRGPVQLDQRDGTRAPFQEGAARQLDGLVVTLHESPVAPASYERAL